MSKKMVVTGGGLVSGSRADYIAKGKLSENEGKVRELFSSSDSGLNRSKANKFLSGNDRLEEGFLRELIFSPERKVFLGLGKNSDKRKVAMQEIMREGLDNLWKELGYSNVRYIGGIHLNTNNPHTHIIYMKDAIDTETGEKIFMPAIPRSWFWRKDGENSKLASFFEEAVARRTLAAPPESLTTKFAKEEIFLPVYEFNEDRIDQTLNRLSEVNAISPHWVEGLTDNKSLYVSRQGALTFIRRDVDGNATGYVYATGYQPQEEKGFFYIGNAKTATKYLIVENPKEALSILELMSGRDLSDVCIVASDKKKTPVAFENFLRERSNEKSVRVIWSLGLDRKKTQEQEFYQDLQVSLLENRKDDAPTLEFYSWSPRQGYGRNWSNQLQMRNLPGELKGIAQKVFVAEKQIESEEIKLEVDLQYNEKVAATFKNVIIDNEGDQFVVYEKVRTEDINADDVKFGKGKEYGRYETLSQTEDEFFTPEFSVISIDGETLGEPLNGFSDELDVINQIIETFGNKIENEFLKAEKQNETASEILTAESENAAATEDVIINQPARNLTAKEKTERIKEIPLEDILTRRGFSLTYDVKRKEYVYRDAGDSFKIKVKNDLWCDRYDDNRGGRNPINLVMHLEGKSFADARAELIDDFGTEYIPQETKNKAVIREAAEQKKTAFVMPDPAENRLPEVADYLIQQRGISPEIVGQMIERGFLFGNSYGSCVFVNKDEKENIKGASWRATRGTKRGDLAGSEKVNAWFYIGDPNAATKFVIVESPIEAMSYYDLHKESLSLENTAIISTATNSVPLSLVKLLEKNAGENAELVIAYNNDQRGQDGALYLLEKIGQFGMLKHRSHFENNLIEPTNFSGKVSLDVPQLEDWNEELKAYRETETYDADHEHVAAEIEADARPESARQQIADIAQLNDLQIHLMETANGTEIKNENGFPLSFDSITAFDNFISRQITENKDEEFFLTSITLSLTDGGTMDKIQLVGSGAEYAATLESIIKKDIENLSAEKQTARKDSEKDFISSEIGYARHLLTGVQSIQNVEEKEIERQETPEIVIAEKAADYYEPEFTRSVKVSVPLHLQGFGRAEILLGRDNPNAKEFHIGYRLTIGGRVIEKLPNRNDQSFAQGKQTLTNGHGQMREAVHSFWSQIGEPQFTMAETTFDASEEKFAAYLLYKSEVSARDMKVKNFAPSFSIKPELSDGEIAMLRKWRELTKEGTFFKVENVFAGVAMTAKPKQNLMYKLISEGLIETEMDGIHTLVKGGQPLTEQAIGQIGKKSFASTLTNSADALHTSLEKTLRIYAAQLKDNRLREDERDFIARQYEKVKNEIAGLDEEKSTGKNLGAEENKAAANLPEQTADAPRREIQIGDDPAADYDLIIANPLKGGLDFKAHQIHLAFHEAYLSDTANVENFGFTYRNRAVTFLSADEAGTITVNFKPTESQAQGKTGEYSIRKLIESGVLIKEDFVRMINLSGAIKEAKAELSARSLNTDYFVRYANDLVFPDSFGLRIKSRFSKGDYVLFSNYENGQVTFAKFEVSSNDGQEIYQFDAKEQLTFVNIGEAVDHLEKREQHFAEKAEEAKRREAEADDQTAATEGFVSTAQPENTENAENQLTVDSAGHSAVPVLPPAGQTGRVETRIAKLLYAHNLAGAIADAQEGFYVRLENDPYMDLHVTKDHASNLIRLTHYYKQNGDLMHDGEMNFFILPDGSLHLNQVAAGLYGMPHYGYDRSFAEMFSKNLIDQGFEKATLIKEYEYDEEIETTIETAEEESEPEDLQNGFTQISAEELFAEIDRTGENSAENNYRYPLALEIEPAGVKKGTISLASEVRDILHDGKSIKNNIAFNKMSEIHFSGSRAAGTFDARDAFDALELGVNLYLLDQGEKFINREPHLVLDEMRELIKRLPTQADRTEEQKLFQQFSTVPTESYVAFVGAGLRPGDVVLEPSAGTATLALWSKLRGLETHVNEISDRRAGILKIIGFDSISRQDAQFLNDTLDQNIKPNVILMNPPFSATGGRTKNRTIYGAEHITDALLRLQPGGRLVAVVGEGMGFDKVTFTSWWADVLAKYTVRANIGVPGDEYAKYGTTFGNQLLVIDKTGRTPGATMQEQLETVVKGDYPNLEAVLEEMKQIGFARFSEFRENEMSITQRAGSVLSEAQLNAIEAAGYKLIETSEEKIDKKVYELGIQYMNRHSLSVLEHFTNRTIVDEMLKANIGIAPTAKAYYDARWEAVGATGGGKIDRIEERGYRALWGIADGENRYDIVGIIGPGADNFLNKGLTIEKVRFAAFEVSDNITRKEIKDNPEKIYLFGDNLKGYGNTGQAREMRGEANSIGIPTKKEPSMESWAFFSDDDYDGNKQAIAQAFAKLAKYTPETVIVVPSAGLGTGFAQLAEKAPKTFSYLNKRLAEIGFDANTALNAQQLSSVQEETLSRAGLIENSLRKSLEMGNLLDQVNLSISENQTRPEVVVSVNSENGLKQVAIVSSSPAGYIYALPDAKTELTALDYELMFLELKSDIERVRRITPERSENLEQIRRRMADSYGSAAKNLDESLAAAGETRIKTKVFVNIVNAEVISRIDLYLTETNEKFGEVHQGTDLFSLSIDGEEVNEVYLMNDLAGEITGEVNKLVEIRTAMLEQIKQSVKIGSNQETVQMQMDLLKSLPFGERELEIYSPLEEIDLYQAGVIESKGATGFSEIHHSEMEADWEESQIKTLVLDNLTDSQKIQIIGQFEEVAQAVDLMIDGERFPLIDRDGVNQANRLIQIFSAQNESVIPPIDLDAWAKSTSQDPNFNEDEDHFTPEETRADYFEQTMNLAASVKHLSESVKVQPATKKGEDEARKNKEKLDNQLSDLAAHVDYAGRYFGQPSEDYLRQELARQGITINKEYQVLIDGLEPGVGRSNAQTAEQMNLFGTTEETKPENIESVNAAKAASVSELMPENSRKFYDDLKEDWKLTKISGKVEKFVSLGSAAHPKPDLMYRVSLRENNGLLYDVLIETDKITETGFDQLKPGDEFSAVGYVSVKVENKRKTQNDLERVIPTNIVSAEWNILSREKEPGETLGNEVEDERPLAADETFTPAPFESWDDETETTGTTPEKAFIEHTVSELRREVLNSTNSDEFFNKIQNRLINLKNSSNPERGDRYEKAVGEIIGADLTKPLSETRQAIDSYYEKLDFEISFEQMSPEWKNNYRTLIDGLKGYSEIVIGENFEQDFNTARAMNIARKMNDGNFQDLGILEFDSAGEFSFYEYKFDLPEIPAEAKRNEHFEKYEGLTMTQAIGLLKESSDFANEGIEPYLMTGSESERRERADALTIVLKHAAMIRRQEIRYENGAKTDPYHMRKMLAGIKAVEEKYGTEARRILEAHLTDDASGIRNLIDGAIEKNLLTTLPPLAVNRTQGENNAAAERNVGSRSGNNNRDGGIQSSLFETANHADEFQHGNGRGSINLSDDDRRRGNGNQPNERIESQTAVSDAQTGTDRQNNGSGQTGVSANDHGSTLTGELEKQNLPELPEGFHYLTGDEKKQLPAHQNSKIVGGQTESITPQAEIGSKWLNAYDGEVYEVLEIEIDGKNSRAFIQDKNSIVHTEGIDNGTSRPIFIPLGVSRSKVQEAAQENELRDIIGVGKNTEKRDRIDDLGVVSYKPAKLTKGVAHPADIVESASMAAVEPPDIKYTPKLDKKIIEEGKLSSLQLEAVIYAGQRHEHRLPNGMRAGIFIGDGTGVGKGRELAGITLDNWNQGRKRVLWLSINYDLVPSTDRDLKDLGADNVPLASLDKHGIKADLNESVGDAVLFASYATLIGKGKDEKTRFDQIVKWLGDDGVILFDEGHLAKNAVSFGMSEASQRGEAVVELQIGEKSNPNWRIVYSSATGATELRNMAYMQRLGLWGEGSGFPGGFVEFYNTIDRGGIGAMEMVARDMKAAGMYMSRSLSFRGVDYRQVHHELTPEQKEIYNLSSRAWSSVLMQFDNALNQTNANSRTKAMAFARLWSGQQMFYRQLMTAIKVPSVIREVERVMDEGSVYTNPKTGEIMNIPAQVVIGIIGTGEARTKDQVTKATELGLTLDDLDFSPKQILLNVVETGFPTKRFTEQIDPGSGKTIKVPVVDANGKHLESQEAVMMRDALLAELNEKVTLPDNPLDQIVNYFGVNRVAEMTGRDKRIIINQETGEREYVKRAREGVAMDKASQDEMLAFQAGRKRIAIISQSASTGISLHSEVKPLLKEYVRRGTITETEAQTVQNAWNENKDFDEVKALTDELGIEIFRRVHITQETSWSADTQMQTFGRSHRSNQLLPPEYVLMSTNLGGEKRFLATIAKRLGSLGALTKGDREQAGGGDLLQYDFENRYGLQAAVRIVSQLRDNAPQLMTLLPLDPVGGEERSGLHMLYIMGLAKRDGNVFTVRDETIENLEVSRFLNRVLMLDVDTQNQVFDAFASEMEHFIERDKELGLFDAGVQDVEGDNIRFGDDPQIVSTDQATGAHTYYYKIHADTPSEPVSLKSIAERNSVVRINGVEISGNEKKQGTFYQQINSKNIVYVENKGARADAKTGKMESYYAFARPSGWQSNLMTQAELVEKFAPVLLDQTKTFKDDVQMTVQDWWNKEFAATPTTHVATYHLISGAVLPVWQRLSSSNEGGGQMSLKTVRIETQEGERVVGVQIPSSQISRVLRDLGVQQSVNTPEEIYGAVLEMKDSFDLTGGIKIKPSFLKGKPVIQIMNLSRYQQNTYSNHGMIREYRGMETQCYVPSDFEKGIDLLKKLLEDNPAVERIDVNGVKRKQKTENSNNTDGDNKTSFAEKIDGVVKKLSGGDKLGNGLLASIGNPHSTFSRQTAALKNEPISSYWWMLKADVTDKGQVLLNAASYEFVRRTYQETMGYDVLEFDGLFNDLAVTGKFFDNIENIERKSGIWAESIGSLRQTLQTAVNSREDGFLILLADENAAAEEELHVSSHLGSVGKDLMERHARFDELINHDAYIIAKPLLSEQYKTTEDGLLVEELWAKTAQGKGHLYHLLPNESAEYTELWFKSFAEKNGYVSKQEFKEITDESARIRDNAYREIYIREQGVNQLSESGESVERGRTLGDVHERTIGTGSSQAQSGANENGLRADDEIDQIRQNAAVSQKLNEAFEKGGSVQGGMLYDSAEEATATGLFKVAELEDRYSTRIAAAAKFGKVESGESEEARTKKLEQFGFSLKENAGIAEPFMKTQYPGVFINQEGKAYQIETDRSFTFSYGGYGDEEWTNAKFATKEAADTFWKENEIAANGETLFRTGEREASETIVRELTDENFRRIQVNELRTKNQDPAQTAKSEENADPIFENFKSIFAESGLEQILEADEAYYKFETPGRNPARYEIKVTSGEIRFVEMEDRAETDRTATESRGIYFNTDDAGDFRYSGSFDRETEGSLADPVKDELWGASDVQYWKDEELGTNFIVTEIDADDEIAGKIKTVNEKNGEIYQARQLGERLIVEAQLKEAEYKLDKFHLEAEDKKYKVTLQNGGAEEIKEISLADLERECRAQSKAAVADAEKTGILAMTAADERISIEDASKREYARTLKVAEDQQKPLIDLVGEKINDERESKLAAIRTANIRFSEAILTTDAVIRQTGERDENITPVIKPEVLWREQIKAAKRGDLETFNQLESIHQETNIPRPNEIYAQLRGAGSIIELKSAEEDKNLLEWTKGDGARKRLYVGLRKDGDEYKVENFRVDQARKTYDELLVEHLDNLNRAAEERGKAGETAKNTLLNQINPFSPVQSKLSWITQPKETLKRHLNPIEVIKNDPGVQIIRGIYKYLEHSSNARELEAAAQEAIEKAQIIREETAPQMAEKANRLDQAVKQSIAHEEDLRADLRRDPAADGDLLKTPDCKLTEQEIKFVGEKSVELGDAELLSKYHVVVAADAEMAEKIGETAEKSVVKNFIQQTRVAAAADQAIGSAEIAADGTIEVEIDLAQYAEVVKHLETAEVTENWQLRRASENEFLRLDLIEAEEAEILVSQTGSNAVSEYVQAEWVKLGDVVAAEMQQPSSIAEQKLLEQMNLEQQTLNMEMTNQMAITTQTENFYDAMARDAEMATQQNIGFQQTAQNFTISNPSELNELSEKKFWQEDRLKREQLASEKDLQNSQTADVRQKMDEMDEFAAEAAEAAEEAEAVAVLSM